MALTLEEQLRKSADESYVDLPPYHKVVCKDPDGEHTCTYLQYGERTAPSYLFFVPGLTGDATNAKYLGEYLSTHHNYCVFAIDLPGRGYSDRFTNLDYYNYTQYASDVYTWITSCLPQDGKKKHVFYLGVSLGGLLAQILATKYPTLPIDAYCFNDIGAHVPHSEIERIHGYLQHDEYFPSREAAAKYFEMVYKAQAGPFADDQYFIDRSIYALKPIPKRAHGDDGQGKKDQDTPTPTAHSDDQSQLIEYTLKMHREGVVHGLLKTDEIPCIEDPEDGKVFSFWDHFKNIQKPVLIYRGELSSLLTAPLLERMKTEHTAKGIPCESITWSETGHVPPLYVEEEFTPLHEFFTKHVLSPKGDAPSPS